MISTEYLSILALIDNDLIIESDVIILLEGDGLNRCEKAMNLLKKKYAPKLLFSGGIKDHDYGSFTAEDVLPHLFNLGLTREQLILETASTNTYEQAIYCKEIALSRGWKNIILVATHDHQYRSYLTFLKVFESTDIFIFNSPARNLPWFQETGWGTRYDRMQLEFKKISKYQELGHLSTFEEAILYQKRKEDYVLKQHQFGR